MKSLSISLPIVVALFFQTATAQDFDPSQVNLIGNRFRPLTYDEMTPPQKTMTQNILAGPRTTMGGPYNVLLRSPEMGDMGQKLGAFARYNASLETTVREMTIIMTAKYWKAEYEWYAHKRAALAAGLDPAIVDAIAEGQRPDGMSYTQSVLYDFCHQLLYVHRLDDAVFDAAVEEFGEKGVVDIIGILGWYGMVSLVLNTDEYPLPEGVEPEFE